MAKQKLVLGENGVSMQKYIAHVAGGTNSVYSDRNNKAGLLRVKLYLFGSKQACQGAAHRVLKDLMNKYKIHATFKISGGYAYHYGRYYAYHYGRYSVAFYVDYPETEQQKAKRAARDDKRAEALKLSPKEIRTKKKQLAAMEKKIDRIENKSNRLAGIFYEHTINHERLLTHGTSKEIGRIVKVWDIGGKLRLMVRQALLLREEREGLMIKVRALRNELIIACNASGIEINF